MSEQSDHSPLGFERVVFFSDAVFAIVITILVLPLTAEFEVPDETTTFAHQLTELWPKILIFLVSFLVVGQFWLAHHRIFTRIGRYDSGLLIINLLFLLAVSFLPFPAAVLGAFGTDDEALPGVFYAASLTAVSVALSCIWIYAVRRGLLTENLTPAQVREVTFGSVTIDVIFALSIAIAAFWFYGAVLFWIVGLPIARKLVSRLRIGS